MPDIIAFNRAHFTQSAPSIRECPPESGREVAFAGRSNAGKSSAINTLTNNSKLARTSKTPGRTQLINYFELTEDTRLVDLPGYGYAKVSLAMKQKWQANLSEYLHERRCLTGLVGVMDIRHPMQEFDTMVINWAVETNMPVHLLLTKADKLKKGPANSVLLDIKKQLREAEVDDLISVQMFSSLKKTGLDELKIKLSSWLLEGGREFDGGDLDTTPDSDDQDALDSDD